MPVLQRIPLYIIWSEIHELCMNASHLGYENYGGRGIRVCAEWQVYDAFHQWATAYGYQSGFYLVRRDPSADFDPESCEWCAAPMTTQAINARKTTLYEAFGEVKSLPAWARDARCNVSLVAIHGRLKLGWDLERALTTPTTTARTRFAFGEAKTLADWGKDPRCAVPLQTVKSRLKCGWMLERALTTPLMTPQTFTVFGETRSYAEWARDARCLVNKACLETRVKMGWEPERALTTPLSEPEYVAFGEQKTMTAWLSDPRCSVGYECLHGRLRLGWTFEEALTTPSRRHSQPTYQAFGEEKTLATWARDPRCLVRKHNLKSRIQLGWDMERAMTTPVEAPLYTAFGEEKRLCEWAQDTRCVVSLNCLDSRLRLGWDLESALTTPRISGNPKRGRRLHSQCDLATSDARKGLGSGTIRRSSSRIGNSLRHLSDNAELSCEKRNCCQTSISQ